MSSIGGQPARTAIPIVALDYPDSASALKLVARLGESCRFYKVGSELFTATGPAVIEYLQSEGCDVFLDLKLHDIPNTVSRAVQRIRTMGVRLTTVHALGGRAMLAAAVEAAGPDCGLLAVTVLTSLDRPGLAEITGAEGDIAEAVVRLATIAASSGVRGVVCSGEEAGPIRSVFGDKLEILVPGIRLPGDSAGDQARIITPEAAQAAGATYVVLGRSVTGSADPRGAMEQVRERLVKSVAPLA